MTEQFAADIEAGYRKALQLNPNDVDIRLEYARALQGLHNPVEASKQYQLALAYNDKLNPDEPKRLALDRIKVIQKTIESLAPH